MSGREAAAWSIALAMSAASMAMWVFIGAALVDGQRHLQARLYALECSVIGAVDP